MVFASFSIKVNEIGSTANAAVLWSVAQIVRFSEWAPNDISTLKGKKGIFVDRIYIKIKEFCRKDWERNHCYSCNNITTTLIQISRLFYFGIFSKTNSDDDLINCNSF